MSSNDNGEAAAAFYDKRRKWLDFVCGHPEVKHATFRVGYWLARRMNSDNQSTWWSVKRIAKTLGVDRKTVMDATAELERLNLLLVVRRLGKGNTYYLKLPFE